jgi:thiosulfate/3-mercaptopyruvate sulfurtransferase
VRDDFQSLRTYAEVLSHWRNAGFRLDKKMYFYCGTGWRSGLYTFYAYLLDWPAASYDGGWFEWTYYPDNPIETGTP